MATNDRARQICGKKLAFALLTVALFIVGCGQQAKDSDYHDPMLRQQLTTMLGDLYTDHAVPKAISDLNAILTVNSEKLSSRQKEELTEARDKMLEMRKILEKMREPGYDPSDAANADSYNDYHRLFLDSKKLIGEAAATF